MSRTASILLGLFGVLFAASCALADPLTTKEVAGTYRIDPSLVRVGQMPTNFLPFTLFLNTNGTFVGSNIPASRIIDSTPPVTEAGGTWKLGYESFTNSLIYKGQNYIFLDYTNAPQLGYQGLVMDVWGAIPLLDKGRPCIKMHYQFPNKNSLVFYLAKQK